MASGIIRRIDSLGRIVIPKEIRKFLKIKENEQVEINLLEDKIVLNKYSDIHENDKNIINLINCIQKTYNKDILITNLNNIIISTNNYYNYLNKEISSYLNNIIKERNNIIENIPLNLNLIEGNEIKVSYIIEPIILNGDIMGLIILLSNNNIENTDLKVINMLKLYLENYLE